jgi:quinoprotein glucose dehydrogenase
MSKRAALSRALGSAILVCGAIVWGLLAHTSSSSAVQGTNLVRGNKPGEWRYWAADAWSTRYSSLDQINAQNFDSLQVAWRWNAGEFGADEYYRTTPLYANGRILTVATSRRMAFALNPADGSLLWKWGMDEGIRWQKAPRRFAGRGPSYWTDGNNERLVVVTPGYHLASLDAKTGIPDPAFGKNGIVDLMEGLGMPLVPLAVDDPDELTYSDLRPMRKARPGEKWDSVTKTGADGTIGIDPSYGQIAASSPAIIVGDVIVVGNSSIHGYYPVRVRNIPGFIRGFDIKTGKMLWKFNLVPQPGEFGAETWKNGSKIGDEGVGKNDAWAPYSADPELGIVYIPVGMPLMDEYGGHRPGDNLFGNSIVALDAKTGVRKWHFQMVHHDIWDYDTPMAPNLMDVTVNGQRRRVVAQTTKQGWVYTFDRVTGAPIWPMPETPVLQSDVPGEQTSPTQPIPSKPVPYAHQGLTEKDLIDYTPAIKDSALKLAQRCRMGPYYVPPAAADGSGSTGIRCSWYAPGASGGVNIDGGAAADPETGMLYVGGQSGLGTATIAKDPCSEFRYSSVRNSCGIPGALPAPAGGATVPPGGRNAATSAIDGISIVKPKEAGGITAYDMNSGDKKWWVPNGNLWRNQTTASPLFAGVTLPRIPALGGQPEVITTRTLVIHGTGRSGGAGGGRAGAGGAGAPPGRAGGAGAAGAGAAAPPPAAAPATGPRLYAFDKATGRQVGAVSIPAVNSAVPMTFLHNGRQYIVFATGSGTNTGLTALALPRR